MLCVYGHYKWLFFRVRLTDRLWTSEFDVYRRQILTIKVDPRAERVDITIALFLRALWLFEARVASLELHQSRFTPAPQARASNDYKLHAPASTAYAVGLAYCHAAEQFNFAVI